MKCRKKYFSAMQKNKNNIHHPNCQEKKRLNVYNTFLAIFESTVYMSSSCLFQLGQKYAVPAQSMHGYWLVGFLQVLQTKYFHYFGKVPAKSFCYCQIQIIFFLRQWIFPDWTFFRFNIIQVG